MSEFTALGRIFGWLIDLYLVIGVMLVIVLVPKVEQAANEYWFSSENSLWTRIIVTIVLGIILVRSCA